MKKIIITPSFELEVSDELYKRIKDNKELEEFCINNCFRNNSRTLREVNIK